MLTRPYLAPVMAVILTLAVGLFGEYGVTLERDRIEQDQRNRTVSAVGQYRATLEGELNASLYLVNGLIGYVETQSRIDPNVAQSMLKTLYAQGRHVRNIGLAPGNRLTYIYPREGNEKAVGLYYPDLPDQWPAVERAIRERQPRLAGPVQLKQGGIGFIYRVPVFIGPQGDYWGILSMVIDQESLFAKAGLRPEVDGLQLALRGKDGTGPQGETFMGDAALFATDAVTATVSTPGGAWQIAARPVGGGAVGERIGWLRGGSWGIGILLGLILFHALAAIAQRLLAEEAVRRSRDDLNEAQRLAALGSWILDLRTKSLTWSDEVFRIFEIDPEAVGASYDAFLRAIHPEDRDVVNRAYAALAANRLPHDIGYRLLFPDGRVKYVREHGETRYAENGRPLRSHGTVQDVTQAREAEEVLRASEERWKFALEGAGDGVWDWNLQTGQLFLSRQEMTVLGYDGEGATYTHIDEWADRQHPDDVPLRKAAIERYFSGAAPLYTCEFRTRARDGGWKWILARGMLVSRTADGKPLRMLGTHTDITERKRMEAALHESEEKLRGLYELAPLGIALTDMDGHYIEFNEAFRQICGYPSDELKTLDYWALTPPEYKDQEAVQLEALTRSGRYGPYEKEYVQKNGYRIPLRLNGMLVTGKDGKHYIWSIVEDITASRSIAEQLMVAKQAAEAGSLAKSQFLATMSHEIRTPLNGILGMAQLLLQSPIAESERQDYARIILNSGETLLTLLNDILDLSKVEAGKLELEVTAFDPQQVLREITALFAEAAHNKGLKVDAEWNGPAKQRYMGDDHRLRQMLSNLVSNAVKFSAQGQVRIDARELERDGQSAVLEFSVADTGIGIPQDKLSLLFQPFSQADGSTTRHYGGTGLGLSIVRNLARLMGGDVGVESEVGKGTRFWFRLRVRLVVAGQDTRQAERPIGKDVYRLAAPCQFSGRVLVVEDNAVNRTVISSLLSKLGLAVSVAEDGRQGIDAVMRGDPVDLVLMDIQMPVMDGYAAAERIRQWEQGSGRAHLPIVALTADAFEADRQRCLAAGMDDFLAKPIVVNALQSVLGRWLGSARAAALG